MTQHPTILDALELAESLDEDSNNYTIVRALKLALRTLAKDQEVTA